MKKYHLIEKEKMMRGLKTTVICYTLDASKGRKLFRANIPHASGDDEGILPITNDHAELHSPASWMYPGSCSRWSKEDEVLIDQDY